MIRNLALGIVLTAAVCHAPTAEAGMGQHYKAWRSFSGAVNAEPALKAEYKQLKKQLKTGRARASKWGGIALMVAGALAQGAGTAEVMDGARKNDFGEMALGGLNMYNGSRTADDGVRIAADGAASLKQKLFYARSKVVEKAAQMGKPFPADKVQEWRAAGLVK
jgi:hypothetical protein